MLNELCKIGTIIFSLGSLPLLFNLGLSVYRDLKQNQGIDKQVGILLIFLFSILFVTALLSLTISTGDVYVNANGLSTDLAPLSRMRSLFFSISNFLTAYAFYKIHRQGLRG